DARASAATMRWLKPSSVFSRRRRFTAAGPGEASKTWSLPRSTGSGGSITTASSSRLGILPRSSMRRPTGAGRQLSRNRCHSSKQVSEKIGAVHGRPAEKAGEEIAKDLEQLLVTSILECRLQHRDRLDPLGYAVARLDQSDLGDRGGNGLLVGRDQLFVQPLARAKAREHHVLPVARRHPGQSQQILRKVEDPHRLAHFQHRHVAANVREERGQKNELDSLRDRHEVTRGLRVRDRDRLPSLELALEDRNHAAVAAENVAEAHRGVRRGRVTLLEIQHDHFREALRRTHDAHGAHRLVCTDQDELLRAVHASSAGYAPGSDHVVPDRLPDIGLHQRHVFVSGRVKHPIGAVRLEHPLYRDVVYHVSDHRNDVEVGETVTKIQLEKEQARLHLIEKDEGSRSVKRYLPCQLGPDGPGRPGDQNRPAVEIRRQFRQFEPDRLPPQEVLDPELSKVIDPNPPGQYLLDPRKDLERQRGCLALTDNPPQFRWPRRRHRDDDLRDPGLPCDPLQLGCPAQHLETVDPRPPLRGIVVHKPYGPVTGREPAEFSTKATSGFTGSDDQYTLRPPVEPRTTVANRLEERAI